MYSVLKVKSHLCLRYQQIKSITANSSPSYPRPTPHTGKSASGGPSSSTVPGPARVPRVPASRSRHTWFVHSKKLVTVFDTDESCCHWGWCRCCTDGGEVWPCGTLASDHSIANHPRPGVRVLESKSWEQSWVCSVVLQRWIRERNDTA